MAETKKSTVKTTKATSEKKTATKTTKTVKKTAPKAVKETVEVEKPVEVKTVKAEKPAVKVEKKSAKQIKVIYTKSCIGYDKRQRKVLESLGLRKLNDSNILPDNDAVRGMVAKINHLVHVENI